MAIRPSYSDSAVVIPSYLDSAVVALRKKIGGLKKKFFCRVKNEKGFVRIVVVKKVVKRKRVMFALNY